MPPELTQVEEAELQKIVDAALEQSREKCSWCKDDFEDGIKFDVDDGTHWCSGCADKYQSNCEDEESQDRRGIDGNLA